MGALGGREIEPVERGLTTQQRWASKPSIVTRSSRGHVWPSATTAAVAVAADAAASAWPDDGYEVGALGVVGGRLDVVRDAAEERALVPAHLAVILDHRRRRSARPHLPVRLLACVSLFGEALCVPALAACSSVPCRARHVDQCSLLQPIRGTVLGPEWLRRRGVIDSCLPSRERRASWLAGSSKQSKTVVRLVP